MSPHLSVTDRYRSARESGIPLIGGHRGNPAEHPENTLAAFRSAIELGVDMIECDVHLSADGELVVIHDHTLDRTTDGTGLVAQRTLAEEDQVVARDDGVGDLWNDGLVISDDPRKELLPRAQAREQVASQFALDGLAHVPASSQVSDRCRLGGAHPPHYRLDWPCPLNCRSLAGTSGLGNPEARSWGVTAAIPPSIPRTR